MFSLFERGPTPLELYGKLPIARDYLRIGAANGAGAALRDWMDRSFSQPHGGSGVPVLPGTTAFLLGEPKDAPILGLIRPSSDAGGLRPFPFALFVEHRRKPLLADLAGDAGRARALWNELERAYAEHANHRDAQSYLGAMRARAYEPERIAPAGQDAIDFAAWRRALDGDSGADRLLGALEALRTLSRGSYDGPVRTPLVHGMSAVAQTHAWWTALCECGLAKRDATPNLLFTRPFADASASHAAFAVFFRRFPTTEQVAWLSAPATDRALGPGDLCPPRPCVAPAEPSPEHAAPLASSVRALLLSLRA